MQRRGLYAHIRRNQFKSIALLIGGIVLYAGALLLLIALPGAALDVHLGANPFARGVDASTPRHDIQAMDIIHRVLDLEFMPVALVALVGALAAVGHSLYVQWQASGVLPGRVISRSEMPWLFNMVENMAIQLGLPVPAIRIVDSDRMASFAHGLSPHRSTIVMTRGLLQALTREEVEAVVAHEISHIRNQDTRFLTIARAFVDTIGVRAYLNMWSSPWQRLSMAISLLALFPILLLIGTPWEIMLLLACLLATLFGVILFASRVVAPNEFVADASAVEITRNPLALASALRKIAGLPSLPMTDRIIAAMMISGPSKGPLATHPPLERRIAAIVRHGGVYADEYRHHAMRDLATSTRQMTPRHPVHASGGFAAGAMHDARPTFGRRSAPPPLAGKRGEDELQQWERQQNHVMKSLAEILDGATARRIAVAIAVLAAMALMLAARSLS